MGAERLRFTSRDAINPLPLMKQVMSPISAPSSNKIVVRIQQCVLLAVILLQGMLQSVYAWDSVGHRISAAVALHFISEETRAELLQILAAHPRYEEDFLDQLPGFIETGDEDAMTEWLLGQAAYWPDIARGLPGQQREQFNRPPWHYTDGAWVRGSALTQGNLYLGIDAFADQAGENGATIRNETDAHNVMTAIDFNTQILSDASYPAEQRAVALCWVLHLMGDIHQPMHTGSLYSRHTFRSGDLGGNRIPVAIGNAGANERLNLHAAWDGALRKYGVADSLPEILTLVSGFTAPRIQGVASDWSAWMSESRQLLHSVVYSDAILSAATEADAQQLQEIAEPVQLSEDYVIRMEQLARQRLGLAGLRLAIWFENELP